MAAKYTLAVKRQVAGNMVYDHYFHTAEEALASMQQGGPAVYLLKFTHLGNIHERNGIRELTQDLVGRRTDAWDQGILATRERKLRVSDAINNPESPCPALETFRLALYRGY